MATHVSRDPFARETLYRDNVPTHGECSWCGQVRRTPKGKPYLYQYSTVTDGGRTHVHRGLFCSKSCHDAFHH